MGVHYSVVGTDEQGHQKVLGTDLPLREARLAARSQYVPAVQTLKAPGEFERYESVNDPDDKSYVSIYRYPPPSTC